MFPLGFICTDKAIISIVAIIAGTFGLTKMLEALTQKNKNE